jgi:hypothetical protein
MPALGESSAVTACVVRAGDGAAGTGDVVATRDPEDAACEEGCCTECTTLPDECDVPGAGAEVAAGLLGRGFGCVAGFVGTGVLDAGGDGTREVGVGVGLGVVVGRVCGLWPRTDPTSLNTPSTVCPTFVTTVPTPASSPPAAVCLWCRCGVAVPFADATLPRTSANASTSRTNAQAAAERREPCRRGPDMESEPFSWGNPDVSSL